MQNLAAEASATRRACSHILPGGLSQVTTGRSMRRAWQCCQPASHSDLPRVLATTYDDPERQAAFLAEVSALVCMGQLGAG